LNRFLHFLFLCFIFIAPGWIFLPHAVAQSWQWGRQNTGSGVDAWAVATDASGNVFGGGVGLWGTSSLDFGSGVSISLSSPTPNTSFWVKYNNSGTPLWAGCTIGGDSWLYNITADPEGNLIIFGSFYGPTIQIGSITLINAYGADTAQYYLAKINPSGTVLWAINDGNTTSDYAALFSGAIEIESNGGVTTDTAGNIYITSSFHKPTMTIGGTTITNTDATGATYDVFLAKYSPAGIPLWARSYGGSNNDYGFGITVAATGNVYVTGAFYSPSIIIGSSTLTNPLVTRFASLAYIAEFTPAGIPEWGQQGTVGASCSYSGGSFGVGLASDNYGNVYMTGGFEDTSISFGDTVITRTYPSAPSIFSGIVALYLVQFSPSHVATWYKTIGSHDTSIWGYSIAMAACGQVWVSGNYNADANIDGHILTRVAGSDPIFLAGYNLAGGVVGYAGLGSGGDDQNGIACDGSGNIFLCSDIYRGDTIYIGPDTVSSAIPLESFYLGKYANVPVVTGTNTDTTITCGDNLRLSGQAGYSIYAWNTGSTDSSITVSSPGVYFVSNFTCGAVVVDSFHVSVISDTTLAVASDSSSCSLDSGFTLAGPTGYSVYAWSTGDTTASITVTDTGSYVVHATHATSLTTCYSLSDTFHISFLATDTLYHHQDTVVCTVADDAYININLAPPAGSSYSWFDGSTGNTDSVFISTSGKFWVSYITGCIYNLDTFAVIVVTPCDSGHHNAGVAVAKSVKDVNLYPNPVADMLTIITGQPGYSSYSIVNVLGQALIRQPINGIQTNVDVTILPAGVYYLVLYNDNGITMRKFVKE